MRTTDTACAHCAYLAKLAKFNPMFLRAIAAHAAAGHPSVPPTADGGK